MKGILNVLYRRILYKIPLKFLLLLLGIGAILFASCNASYIYNSINLISSGTITLNSSSYTNIFNYGNKGAGTYCIKLSSSNPQTLTFGFTNSSSGTPNNLYQLYNDQYENWICLYGNNQYFNAKLTTSSNTVNYEVFYLEDLLNSPSLIDVSVSNNCFGSYLSYNCENQSTYTFTGGQYPTSLVLLGASLIKQSGEKYFIKGNNSSVCDYSGYILESSIDSTYCENNGLCSSSFSGDSNWSALYINNIQHLGGPNIFIDIPEEISRDYDYIDEDMYINVSGYNVDYDKITGIINTQNYKPSSDDFTYIVKNLIPLFIPGLVIILFIYWLFKFIKKIF